MPNLTKPELVAPAGNWTMLNAVLENGADAVYFGIDSFNMRVKADNFGIDDIKAIVDLAGKYGAKTHLALNIIVYNDELDEVEQIIREAKLSGVDMIVCWDLAIISLCKKHGMSFYVSTQASASNILSVNMFKDLGARRVVLARECSLEQIKEIKSKCNIEIEVFIHGAMCVAISGRCFMSHEMFSKSANRGECHQSCRREYEIYDKRKDVCLLLGEDYVMSAKDLCTIDFIDEVIKTGADALKIEGRKRSPEYAATVTSVYRNAIDLFFAGKLTNSIKNKLKEELSQVYNRDFSSGFYFSEPGTEDFTKHEGNISKVKKLFIGSILNYYAKNCVAYARIESDELNIGDEILIIGSTTGVKKGIIEEIIVNEGQGKSARRGDLVTFPFQHKVRENDKIYKLITDNSNQRYFQEHES